MAAFPRHLLLAPSIAVAGDARAAAGEEPDLPRPLGIGEGAALLAERALASKGAWVRLAELCDSVGHRLAGSVAMERAVAWAAATLRADGLDVALEPVAVPSWWRGEERVELVAPYPRRLRVHTLGGSVGTGPEGITGEVLVVGSFEELAARAGEAAGRIVLYDAPWESYGQAVQFRAAGASRAAAVGALAALVRSPTPTSLATPHTGGLSYEAGAARIPGVALTTEDSAWLRRLAARGQAPVVHLVLGAEDRGTVTSHNVVATVRGRERPEESVILACHLDSWDVGQGAQDDGAGCAAAMEAGHLLAALRVPPRRSVRVVLFTNEEYGLSGGLAYAQAHAGEIALISAAIEADTGAGEPLGFGLDLRDPATGEAAGEAARAALAVLRPHAGLLGPIGATALDVGGSGSDISPLAARGVPTLGLRQDTAGYWPVHHTEADTLDKVDPALLARNAAALAVMGWLLAELPAPLPRVSPPGP